MSDPSIRAREQRIIEAAGRWWREHEAGFGPSEDAFLAMHPDLQPELSARVHFLKRLRVHQSAIHLTPRLRDSRRLHLARSPDRSPASLRPLFAPDNALANDWPEIEFAPGTLIAGRYVLSCLLGNGGLGVVYRAYDQVLQKPVALKFFRSSLISDRHQLVQREVALSQRVSHVNVCRVHDLNIEHDPRFLSMEYIDGEDLDRTLQRVGRILESRALQMASEIAAGLAAAHAMGVLHRDLKPQNIMIDGAGVSRITDFGLGSLVHAHDASDLAGGTFRYMAPELVYGEEATTKSDLFSLGIVFYELYTGIHPLDSQPHDRISWDSIVPPSELVPDIDENVERTIMSCLARLPASRPDSAESVCRRLHGESIPSSGSDALDDPHASTRTIRSLAIAAVIAIFASWLAAPHFRLLNQRRIANPHLEAYRQTAIDILHSQSRRVELQEGLVASGVAYDAPFVNDRTAPGQTLSYWYRQSDQPLRPQRFVLSRDQHTVRTSFEDPAWNRLAMVGVRINLNGRLVEYRAFPRLPPQPGAATSVIDELSSNSSDGVVPSLVSAANHDPVSEPSLDSLSSLDALFQFAGLDRNQYEPTLEELAAHSGPTMLASLGSTQVYRARSSHGSDESAEVLVQQVGRDVVSFRVQPRIAVQSARSPVNGKKWHSLLHVGFMLSGIIGCLLARRNAARQQIDRRVAWRSSLTIFGFAWVGWYFTASHSLVFEAEFQLIQFGVANAIFWAATQWFLFMSLEPFLRKGNPESLTSWMRLFHGKWRDPLVARDLLLGSAIGSSLIPVLGTLHHLGRAALGWTPRFEIPPLELLAISDRSGMLALVANSVVNSFYSAILLLFLHRICCRTLGHPIAGSLASWLTLTWFMGCRYDAGVTPITDYLAWYAYMSLWAGVFLLVIERLGLLATVAMLTFFQAMLYTPGTLDWSLWYAPIGITSALVLALVVIVYAVATSMDILQNGNRNNRLLSMRNS